MELKKDVTHGTRNYPFQIHMTNLKDGLHLYPHVHDEMEITCITKGKGIFFINHQEYHVKIGDILIIPSNSIHLAKPTCIEEASFCSIVFSPNCLYLSSQSLIYSKYIEPFMNKKIFFESYLDGSKPWHKEIFSIIKEMENFVGKTDIELLEQSALLKLWYILLQNCAMQKYATSRNSLRMKSCIDYMYEHFSENISVRDLAELVHMSEGHFSRTFKEYMKVSAMEFLMCLRIEESKKLLRESESSIGEIALLCGFRDFSYFSKCFRNIVKISPKEYRKGIEVEGYL